MSDLKTPRLPGRDLDVIVHRGEVEFSDPEEDDATIRAAEAFVHRIGEAGRVK